MAIEEQQIKKLKEKINNVFNEEELKVLNYSKTYTPKVKVPVELEKTYIQMNNCNDNIKWYRECITKISKLLV